MNPHLRPSSVQLLHYQWFRLQPAVKEAARAAHYKIWGSMENFPILSNEEEIEEVGMGLAGQEAGLGGQDAGIEGQEAGLNESFASLLLRKEQEQGPWRTEEEEEKRQEQEVREMQEAGLGALQPVLGAGVVEVASEVEGGEPNTRQKSGIKQRLRPRRHSVTDSLQSGGKRKAVAEDRNEVFQAVMSRKRRKSEAQPAHTGREGGRRGRRRSTGVR